ncbi:phosphoglucomutase/phosphomannomutase, alpha/beta/alpha domain III domain-containing protein [Phthorimaea operculella]|nr:phosphoglucomutase/phosphomannomutase, alpha/beta/alpha domain III domain-containing protein [Phthorimaea operculella]
MVGGLIGRCNSDTRVHRVVGRLGVPLEKKNWYACRVYWSVHWLPLWWVVQQHVSSGSGEEVYVLASIVSSKMLRAILNGKGHFVETLTGFKWMGNASLILAKEGKLPLFAFEEAIGYMCNVRVPDKDGISAAVQVSHYHTSYCSPLLDTAVHCWTLQFTAGHCSPLLDTAAHCWTLQSTAGHCSPLLDTAVHCSPLLDTAAHCWTLQPTAGHCSPLLDTAVHCWT